MEIHKHPNFSLPTPIPTFLPPLNDIALIKVRENITSMKAIRGNKLSDVKSICLPKEHIFHTEDEYALNSGWNLRNKGLPLQIGYKRVRLLLLPEWDLPLEFLNFTLKLNDTSLNLIHTTVVDNQTRNCRVLYFHLIKIFSIF